jgi:outer membrane protein OmpA-like peptidoglycan-associated protein
MNLLLLASIAAAQTSNGDAPTLNAQLYRPSIDSERTIWTDTSERNPARHITGRVMMSYVNHPLVYLADDGSKTVLVGHLVQNDFMGGITLGRVRLGAYVPVYTRSIGDVGAFSGLGDLAVGAKVNILDAQDGAPLGLAVNARLMAPTSTMTGPLRTGGFGAEGTVIVDKELGPILLAANLGYRYQPTAELENVSWGSGLVGRAAVSYATGDNSGLALDLSSNGVLAGLGEPAGRPAEAMVSGYIGVGQTDFVLRGGVGTGLTRGIGAPRLRAVGMFSYEPPKIRDRDADGVVDAEDMCPGDPEDMDNYLDLDGCPEPTEVTVIFQDEDGTRLVGVTSSVDGQDASGPVALEAGDHGLTASKETFGTLDTTISVPSGPPVEIVQTMGALPGTLKVRAVDPDGNPLDGKVSIKGAGALDLKSGDAEKELAKGTYTVRVEVEGFFAKNNTVTVPAGGEALLEITLEPEIAKVTAERIEISESVFFETGNAVIKPESYALLDQVASILVDHPEITKMRVEGHTDSRGKADDNLQLSQERAASVVIYLESKGVAAERLESEGFGEDKPLVKGNNEKAWSQNRRVDFFIAERTDEEETE